MFFPNSIGFLFFIILGNIFYGVSNMPPGLPFFYDFWLLETLIIFWSLSVKSIALIKLVPLLFLIADSLILRFVDPPSPITEYLLASYFYIFALTPKDTNPLEFKLFLLF